MKYVISNEIHDIVEIKHHYFTPKSPPLRMQACRMMTSPVKSPRKGQWRGNLMFSVICTGINAWVNNGEAGYLKRHRVIIMTSPQCESIVLEFWNLQDTSNHHWFRWWPDFRSAPRHYLNQCWVIVNWTLRNKIQWNISRNLNIFI